MSDRPGGESIIEHLRKLDHWTFLLALGLVLVNIAVESRYLSLAAACFLLVALGYDVYEFYEESDSDSSASELSS